MQPIEVTNEVAIALRNVNLDFEVVARDHGTNRAQTLIVTGLKDINLTIQTGEIVGVVGFNGAGKTTLVRTMAGIYSPTSGTVLVRAEPRVLGARGALKPRLTGRENIALGCLALGATRDELEAYESEIVEFAELGEFIDLPMETYSSGMTARLLFGIHTTAEPEILLLDEALAVGDHKFVERSHARMARMREHTGAVVMVSHALPMIRNTCSRVVWVDNAMIRADGDPDAVLDAFRAAREQRQRRVRSGQGLDDQQTIRHAGERGRRENGKPTFWSRRRRS